MGSCLSSSLHSSSSSSQQQLQTETATIISVNGELKECPTPINVLQVLTIFFKPQADDDDHDEASFGYFLCNSDSLCYDEYIPAMKSDELLQPTQIYFLLPTSRLQYRLSATDMAAMAVKASAALQKRDGHNRKKARISPEVVSNSRYQENSKSVQETITPFSRKPAAAGSERSGSGGYARSSSIRRLQRYSSRRAKLAVRSFRLILSTIYE